MKRVISVLLALILLVAASSYQLMAADKVILRLGNVVPPTSSKNLACLKFAELVQNGTGGQVQVQVFPASQLGTEPQLAQSVTMNMLDIYWGDVGSFNSYVPQVSVFNAPLVFKSTQHWDAAVWGPIFDEMAADLQKKAGIRIVGRMWMGERYILTSKKKVSKPEDMKNLKIRVPEIPIYVAAYRHLGATPTPLAYNEVYLALQQGLIDGLENPVDLVRANKFYEVCKYLTTVPVVNAINILALNESVFQKLTPKQQEVVVQAGKDASAYLSQLMTKEAEENLKFFKEKGMTIIRPKLDPWLAKLQDFPAKNASLWGGDPNLYFKVQSFGSKK